jgi:glycosyltransferase involved in cell wall biosynthesis
LLEAQWLGLPAVASTVDGLPEVIVEGENGLLVPPEDPPALARALVRALTDEALYERLHRNCLRIAAERFAPAVMARRFQEVYAAAVGMASRRGPDTR